MDYISAVILGIIQGIAEWLPISSEAIVTLFGKFLFELEYSEALTNAIWLHTGTLISAVVYFRKDIIEILRMEKKDLLIFLIIATIATGIIAFPLLYLAFSIEIPDYLFTILIGLFLIMVSFMQKKMIFGTKEQPNKKNALIAGLIQGLAVFPGLSRSGITIATLIAQKYNLKTAFKLSFLMSIPVSFGVQVALPLVKEGFSVSPEMVAGALSAAVIGYFTIDILLKFSEKVNFSKATFILGILIMVLGAGLFSL